MLGMIIKSTVVLFLLLFTVNANPSVGVYQLVEPIDHSECPTWDTRNNLLYYVNQYNGEIYRYNYSSSTQTMIKLNGTIGPIIPSENNPDLLIAGLNRQVVAVEWNGKSEPRTQVLANLSPQFPTSRTNDGKADIKGRLWIGTMGHANKDGSGLQHNEGVLYKLTYDTLNSPIVEEAPVNISNGMAWNAANDRYYFIDTTAKQVFGYVYDGETGTISNKRVVFDVKTHSDQITGEPDGMTIDEDDNLWIALNGGGSIVQVNSTSGELLRIIALPAQYVTSAVWGGPDLDILFVTTSRVKLNQTQRLQFSAAGAVFAVVGLGTRGRPMFNVNLTH